MKPLLLASTALLLCRLLLVTLCHCNWMAMASSWPDFYFGYIFTSKAETAATINTDKWTGGATRKTTSCRNSKQKTDDLI